MIFFKRNERFSLLFFILCFGGLLMYVILAFYTFHNSLTSLSQTRRVQKKMQNIQDSDIDIYASTDAVTKYILLWKFKEDDENPIGEGRKTFIERGCMHHNCYLTTDKTMLGAVSSFDAIIFDVKDLKRWKKDRFPTKRDTKQKYVFYGKMSAYENPICHPHADNFFNWTWSYKLYSDIFSPFIEVRDMKGNYVAPSLSASWRLREIINVATEDQTYTNNNTNNHKKAMATVLEDCYINNELKAKLVALKTIQKNFKEYKMDFDIYGCKFIKCPDGDCVSAMKDKYYFYWVHELGLTEDYLTDEVIKSHEINAVPVIFGGADLSKFLPPDSYINAYLTDPDTLVASIFYFIKKPSVYQQFMTWKDYYTITRADPYKGLCQLCSFLKSKKKMAPKHYSMFRRWWYQGPLHERCIKRFRNSEEPLAYLNESRSAVLNEYRIVPLATKKRVENKIKKDTSQL